ncbi:MAG: hypothetical protein ACRD12_23700 [Acidimicrobiales bacterium]
MPVTPSVSAATDVTNGIAVGVFPEFPTRIAAGATNVSVSINLINGSSGGEATGDLTVTELTLVASCGTFSPTCADGADPGVFLLSETGTGTAGTNCAGTAFDITGADSATGRVRFTRTDGFPLVLAGTDITSELDTCRIRFSVSNLQMPAVDSYPTLDEAQTNQVGYMSVRHANGSTGSDQGEDVTTIVSGSTGTTTTTTAPLPTTTTTKPPATTTTTQPPATTTTTQPRPSKGRPPKPPRPPK